MLYLWSTAKKLSSETRAWPAPRRSGVMVRSLAHQHHEDRFFPDDAGFYLSVGLYLLLLYNLFYDIYIREQARSFAAPIPRTPNTPERGGTRTMAQAMKTTL